MDLKSMLNDATSQRQPPPRLQTTPSFERPPATPSYESYSARSQSNPQSLSAAEHRSPANGSYFAVQSPHQQISPPAVTPGITGQSIYSQSPGPHGQLQTPHDGLPPSLPYQSPFVPSPSGPQPPTPGSAHHYQTPSSAATYHHPAPQSTFTGLSPREDASSSNGSTRPDSRNLSPQAPFHPPPAPLTPLGPPVLYPRPSPYQQRPLSQGQEGFRRLSVSSIGSTLSREHMQQTHGQSDHSRSGSTHRTYSGEIRERERERSVESVSPKTIPRPSPHRRESLSQQEPTRSSSHPAAQIPADQSSIMQLRSTDEDNHHDVAPKLTSPPAELRDRSQRQLSGPSPSAAAVDNTTPQSIRSPFPAQSSPQETIQPTLKRNASRISSANATPQPPRKRLRRDEIPIFARSARTRPLKFIKAPPVIEAVKSQPIVKKEAGGHQTPNGQGQAQAQSFVPTAASHDEPQWEPSIMNVVPYEDLSRKVSDWIFQTIGLANPPGGGAMFEIEAKIGSIVDENTGYRLNLPVETEALFNRDKFRGRTSFHSSMDMAQHQLLNTFLNSLVEESVRESQTSGRQVIGYDHPHEFDEFYDLTEEGRRNLAPSIITWLNPRHKPRVRRTIDEGSGLIKAQIIKSRIADIDIYNPGCDFDYRISISIESPWEGEPHWLSEMTDGGRDRKKDRMSYRHMAYQIDLTQVSYPNRPEKEHELEVEISTEQIRIQLQNLRDRRPSRYEDLVRGFLDNVRILCRKGTVNRAR